MKSLLNEMKKRFDEIESSDYCDSCDRPKDQCVCENEEELDEQNVTSAVAGFSTPAAFAKPGKWKNKTKTHESVNTPPSFRWKDDTYQRPESEEEEFNDKFPFSDDEKDWFNKSYEYPSKPMPNKPSKHMKSVSEIIDKKYERLVESYRAYATGNSKSTPEQKIKQTIKEVARQLQEIEQTVNYASRLKTESGVARNGYGTSVEKSLNKISERLIKISERVRALGE
jgi:hypothetical protein